MKFFADTQPTTDALKCFVTSLITGVQLAVTTIDVSKQENKTPDFLAKSPLAKLPVIQADNINYLFDANTICRFLCSKNDKVILIGNDLNGSLVDQWMEWESTLSADQLLQKVEQHLSSLGANKAHLVEGRQTLSLADIIVWSALYLHLSSTSNTNQRSQFPLAAEWFDQLITENQKFFTQAVKLSKL